MKELIIPTLVIVVLLYSMKVRGARGRIAGGLFQLAFAILVYIITRDFLGTSIHDVMPAKIAEFLFKYFLFLATIFICGLLGLGNLFIGIMNKVNHGMPRHPAIR